jgi:hypothetical protein
MRLFSSHDLGHEFGKLILVDSGCFLCFFNQFFFLKFHISTPDLLRLEFHDLLEFYF